MRENRYQRDTFVNKSWKSMENPNPKNCLVVEPTHLKKNSSQIGSFPQLGMKMKKLLKPQTR